MKHVYAIALAVWLGLAGALFAWDTRPTPTLSDGTPLQLPLPASEHMQNVGGSDGAGLCVYTSVTLSAHWHNIPEAYNLRKFAEGRPGGSYPEKLAADIKTYAARYNVKLPSYVQHTGGDDAFLDLCMATRRYPGITYAGRDDFYRDTIAHMVNLVHLDSHSGAIQDNNRAGRWTSDTRQKVLNRWKGLDDNGKPLRAGRMEIGGGWAFVWIAPPAPPLPPTAADEVEKARAAGTWERIVIGDSYKGQWDERGLVVWVYWEKGEAIGGFHKRVFRDVTVLHGEVIGLGEPKQCPCGVCPPCDEVTDDHNHGIDIARVGNTPRYWINDVEVSRDRAHALVSDAGDGLVDDSDKYHLSIVGGDKAVLLAKFGLGGAFEKYGRRLHVQIYGGADWPAKSLTSVVTLQEPAKRGGKVVGTAANWTDVSLQKVLGDVFDPPPVKPDPKPPIMPDPKPPEPSPAPTPPVTPAPPVSPDMPKWVVWVLGLLALLLAKRK